MSPPVSLRTFDLSPYFYPQTFPEGSLLTGRIVHVIQLSTAVDLANRFCGLPSGTADPSVLAAALKAVGRNTSKHKLLMIDNVRGAESLSSEDWDSVFSPLLSDHSSLEAVCVVCTGMMLSAACSQIGHLLARSSTLEILWFGPLTDSDVYNKSDTGLSNAVVKTLSEGLVQTKCLRTVGVTGWFFGEKFADVLKSAFAANVSNTSLEWVDLPATVEGWGMAFEALFSNRYTALKKIRVKFDSGRGIKDGVDNFQMVAESLLRWQESDFATSREVHMDFVLPSNLEVGDAGHMTVLSCWDKWVSANERAHALMLETRLEFQEVGFGGDERFMNEILKRSTQIKNLHICLHWFGDQTWHRDYSIDVDRFSLLCESIQSTDSAESISIRDPGLLFDCCAPLLRCLQHKRRLKELTWHGFDGSYGEENFRSLMDLLHVNIYLKVADISWVPGGKKVLVQEALRRSREQATYFSILRDAKFSFEEARAARVFLCGHPLAGKTSLRVTMMTTRQKESRILEYWKRKDKMEQYDRDLGHEWASIVGHFRSEYERALNLHATPFHINAWDHEEVDLLVGNLFELMSEMLRKKTPQAPSVCCKLVSEILGRQDASSRQMLAQPVLGPRILRSYLKEIRIKGHGNQETSLSGDCDSENGLVTEGTLGNILKKLSESCRKKNISVDRHVLQDLLSESEWQYFGYRLLCADTNTSLTAATFPRFQIRFSKEIVTNDETCILQRNIIRLDHNREGYSIIIENAEDGAHIDVLFQFSKRQRRDEAMLYVTEHILQEFKKFCASPDGCRGVTLETAIIRPECSQRLTPQKYRKEQVILERHLKDLFRKTVEKKFNLGQVTWPRDSKEGDLDVFNYEHFWKAVPEAGLFKGSQQIVELLSERDVEEIMEPIRERSRLIVERLTEVEQQLDSQLPQSAEGGLNNLSDERLSWRSEGVSSGCTKEDKKFSELHEHLEHVREHVEEHVDKAIASLSEQLQAIRKDIHQLQERLHTTLLSITTKIDTMLDTQLPVVGGFIPELGDLSSGLVPVNKMTLTELNNRRLSSLPKVDEEVWKFLRETIEPAKIPEDFRLHLVRYNSEIVLAGQSCAWLCRKCIDEGEKNDILKQL
ncbi:hypothetical protein R1sor_004416 [Riccia sorocarpa]|uniref:Uncharacterized protein n=1 Tax=Riccia sorocarpa TaxID=122646 RepID=A0ABD3HGP1_9MARC